MGRFLNTRLIIGLLLLLLAAVMVSAEARSRLSRVGGPAIPSVTVQNYVAGSGLGFWDQIQRFDTNGDAIDGAAGGNGTGFAQFGSVFYEYASGQYCGSIFDTPGTPNCGVVVYKSTDHLNWQRLGLLTDPASYTCNAQDYESEGAGGMIYDGANARYVFWLACPVDSSHFWRVWYCTTPAGLADGGTCAQQTVPTVHCGQSGVYGGVGQLFVDDDGLGYLKCDYNRGITVTRLNATFSDSSGSDVSFNAGFGEAGGMFKWLDNKYYVTIGLNCSLCVDGSDNWLWRATSPLGPYTDLSTTMNNPQGTPTGSCQAQAGNVETITTAAGKFWLARGSQYTGTFTYGLSNSYVGLITDQGGLPRFACAETTTIPGLSAVAQPGPSAGIDQSSENGRFFAMGGVWGPAKQGIDTNIWYLQTFTPTQNHISTLDITTAQNNEQCASSNFPPTGCQVANGNLVVSLVNVNQSTFAPTSTIASVSIPGSSINWVAARYTVTFNQGLTPGTIYGIQLSGTNTLSGFVLEMDYSNPYPGGKLLTSRNGGSTWALYSQFTGQSGTPATAGSTDIRFREFY